MPRGFLRGRCFHGQPLWPPILWQMLPHLCVQQTERWRQTKIIWNKVAVNFPVFFCYSFLLGLRVVQVTCYYIVNENGKILRLLRECPGDSCGAGVFMVKYYYYIAKQTCSRTLSSLHSLEPWEWGMFTAPDFCVWKFWLFLFHSKCEK